MHFNGYHVIYTIIINVLQSNQMVYRKNSIYHLDFLRGPVWDRFSSPFLVASY